MSMFGMDTSLGLLGAGSAASVLGSVLGAGGSGRAGRKSRDWYDKQTASGMARTGRFYFGPEVDQYIHDSYGLYDKQPGQAGSFLAGQGGSVSQRLRAMIEAVSGRQTGNLGYFDQDTQRLAALDKKALAGYDKSAGALMAKATQGEDLAKHWGLGRDRIIREDAARDLTAADDQSKALLASAGLAGSTAMGQALAGNRERVGRSRDRALQDLGESQIDRQLGASSRTLQAGLQLDVGKNAAQQLAVNRAYGRSGDRMALEERNLTRDIGLRQGELDSAMQVLMSPQFNPWLGQDTSRYFPGSSALAAGLQAAGSGASALGSYGLGQNATLDLLRRLQQTGGTSLDYTGVQI